MYQLIFGCYPCDAANMEEIFIKKIKNKIKFSKEGVKISDEMK